MRHSARMAIVMLACSWAVPANAAPDRTKAKAKARPKPQYELKVEAPEGFVEMFVAGVLTTDNGPAVVLRDKTEKVLLPIWIGLSEAHSIQLRLERRRFPRPLTHDLLDKIVSDLGGKLVKIHVDDLKGDTFVGTVFIRKNGTVAHYDARPSDSIALALGNRAPIYVSRAVLERVNAKRDAREENEKNEKNEEHEIRRPPKAVRTL